MSESAYADHKHTWTAGKMELIVQMQKKWEREREKIFSEEIVIKFLNLHANCFLKQINYLFKILDYTETYTGIMPIRGQSTYLLIRHTHTQLWKKKTYIEMLIFAAVAASVQFWKTIYSTFYSFFSFYLFVWCEWYAIEMGKWNCDKNLNFLYKNPISLSICSNLDKFNDHSMPIIAVVEFQWNRERNREREIRTYESIYRFFRGRINSPVQK